jgi:hypothetical protein
MQKETAREADRTFYSGLALTLVASTEFLDLLTGLVLLPCWLTTSPMRELAQGQSHTCTRRTRQP